MSASAAQPAGVLLPVQALVVAGVGVGWSWSPPPPTRARLMRLLPSALDTVAPKLKTLVAAGAMAVAEVQVTTLLLALQDQFAACAPPRTSAPSGTLMPAGSTSTTVTVPRVGAWPWLLTVRAYVVGPLTSVLVPLDLASRRSGKHWAPGTTPGTSGDWKVLRPPLRPNAP